MSESAPRFLFVPVSGAGGAGEFMRSLLIARAVRERWPRAYVHFIVNEAAAYARDLEFSHTLMQRSPTYNVAGVNEVIVRERPHVVIFDSSGRVAQYRQAKAAGAAVVYVSSRFKTRWKGFRLRRMRYFDQHWIAQPRVLGLDLTRWERLKMRLIPQVEIVFLDPVFETATMTRREQLLAELHVRAGEYIALCIGSGGRYAQVSDPAAVLRAAAERVQRRTGLPCVAVTGGNALANASAREGVHWLASLPNGDLMALLAAARVAVVNGGSLLLQAIANQVPAVAVPVAGDQTERIRRCVEHGVSVPAALDADAIAAAVVSLIEDPARLTDLQRTSRQLGLTNGAPTAVEALARLLPARG